MTNTIEALKAIPGFNISTEQGDYHDETIIEGAIGREGFGEYIRRSDAIAALQAEQGRKNFLITPAIRAALDEAARTGALVADVPGMGTCFINRGDQPENYSDLNCPHCGGSGHKDDVTTPPAEQWVSVKERLPRSYQSVLVWPRPCDFASDAYVQADGTWRYKVYTNFGVQHQQCDVTHWMEVKPPIDSTDAGDKHE